VKKSMTRVGGTSSKPNGTAPDIGALMLDGTEVDAAFDRAVRRALHEHKNAGNPVAVLRDGKVIWVPPEEIEVDDPAAAPAKPKRTGKRRRKAAKA